MAEKIDRGDKNNRYVEITEIIKNNPSVLKIHNIFQQVVAAVSLAEYKKLSFNWLSVND